MQTTTATRNGFSWVTPDLVKGKEPEFAPGTGGSEQARALFGQILTSENRDGTDLSSQACSEFAFECGYSLVSMPWLGRYLALHALSAADSSISESLRTGALVACAFLPPDHIPAISVKNGKVFGNIGPVAHGLGADLLVTVCDAASVILVDLHSNGVTANEAASIDPETMAANLTFDGAEVIFASQDPSLKLFLRSAAATLKAFEQIGGAQRCLDQTVDYVRTHHAFGQPIGAFQAVKHKLADILVAIELARANASSALESLTGADSALFERSCFARVSASEAYQLSAQEGMHLHGAVGTTWDSGMHRYLRRSRSLIAELGSSTLWSEMLARRMASGTISNLASEYPRSERHQAFRAAARSWLEDNAVARDQGDIASGLWGRGYPDDEEIKAAKAWQKRKFDSGWAGISWPKQFGGGGESVLKQVIWDQEEKAFSTPRNLSFLALSHIGYAIIQHGSADQKARNLPRILSGEELWCQLFSEPGAGSDLAGLETSAVRQGEKWVVSGAKIWTSDAGYADRGLLIARTDPDVPKHRGLTCFLVDMNDPKIRVEHIRQASGAEHFSKVTFDDVIISDAQRLGEVGGGWEVGLTTLLAERLLVSLPVPFGGFGGPRLTDLINTASDAQGRALDTDGALSIWRDIAGFLVVQNALESISYRLLSELESGGPLGSEATIAKLAANELGQAIVNRGLDILDDYPAESGDHVRIAYYDALLERPLLRIAGGTDEILRTIIGERMLSLPQDAFAPKRLSFREFKALTAN